ncbi:MAG: SPOR domain-containing protein [bacterium]|nr:SPOR domain-containing protein [bacterium]
MNRALHAALRLLAATSVAALSTSGCASHAQTAPVYHGTAPAVSTDTAVREEFDPARFRDDLILIQPAFRAPAPVSVSEAPDTIISVVPARLAETNVATADSVDIVIYQVQVIALRQQEGAERIAEELRRRFDVPAEVTPQGRLFAVRAGHLSRSSDADELRLQIAALSRGYEGAFLVTDTLRSAQTPSAAVAVPPADSVVVETLTTAAAIPDTALAPEEPELFRLQGWRVLIGQFMDQAGAQEYRRQVMKRLKREDVSSTFDAPWHKVLAGSFRTETEAQNFVERCRSLGFRTAMAVRAEVYLPREEGEIR